MSGIAPVPQLQTHPCSSSPSPSHHGSPLFCPCYLCNQDMQTRMYSEPADKISNNISHPSLAKSRGKLRRETWGADGISPVLLDPIDLNVKQMEPRHSSKTHCPVWLCWHFIWIYLFILLKIHLCSQVGNQSAQTESFSRDLLPLSERGRERGEFGQLTDVWKKSYQKAQSLVCLCMLGLGPKFSGLVCIRNNKFMATYYPPISIAIIIIWSQRIPTEPEENLRILHHTLLHTAINNR